ncbi:hypothetical protein QBC41DRAFT_331287 [Cercophora samala]|uniref:Uncharacterized protein n=1 Tax=Cercophora samala TaxID=330535 RepID=A0AA39YWD1_9PEZI|nr:hypothetical protein QBC41DRAFT_331287 [Cercophora samala]
MTYRTYRQISRRDFYLRHYIEPLYPSTSSTPPSTMNLTPIKVKGRGRKPAWQPPDPSRIKSSRRRDAEDDHDNVKSNSSRSSKRSKKSAPEMSRLESLPAEILWPIAVRSQNPDLMRVNKFLRHVLSARSFALEMTVAAFGPTWDVYFGRPKSRISSRRDDYEISQSPGDPQFQGNVLAARWMNIDHMLEAQQVWYRQQRTERLWEKAACLWWTSPPEIPQIQEEPKSEEDQQVEGEQEARDPLQDVARIPERFNEDWQEFCDACSFDEQTGAYQSIVLNVYEDKKEGHLDLHPLTVIPDRFLTGPFDLKTVKLLFWLARGGARILPEHNWEVTKRGFEQVMADESPLAAYVIYFYHVLGVFNKGHWPDFVLEEKFNWLRERKQDMLSTMPDGTHLWKHRLCDFAFSFIGSHLEVRAQQRW